jgi:hypothetical protein
VPVNPADVVSQIRTRSIGEQVKVPVFRLIARGTCPLTSSMPVGLLMLTPDSVNRPVSRTRPSAAFIAPALLPAMFGVDDSVLSWSTSMIGPTPEEPAP